MSRLNLQSLSRTADAVNAAFFAGESIPAAERERIAGFIAGRLGLPGAYAGTFALFAAERRSGIRLFTGERAANASARHIGGQEACRALRLLQPRLAAAQSALDAATTSLRGRIGPPAPGDPTFKDIPADWRMQYRGGTYCCGPCTVGFWRHLLAGGFDQPEERLARGLRCLRTSRKGDSQWRRFPFWYTISALVEMKIPAAREEMRYAAPCCERLAARKSGDRYARRRAELAQRLLALV